MGVMTSIKDKICGLSDESTYGLMWDSTWRFVNSLDKDSVWDSAKMSVTRFMRNYDFS